jgi:hypothetical protein
LLRKDPSQRERQRTRQYVVSITTESLSLHHKWQRIHPSPSLTREGHVCASIKSNKWFISCRRTQVKIILRPAAWRLDLTLTWWVAGIHFVKNKRIPLVKRKQAMFIELFNVVKAHVQYRLCWRNDEYDMWHDMAHQNNRECLSHWDKEES